MMAADSLVWPLGLAVALEGETARLRAQLADWQAWTIDPTPEPPLVAAIARVAGLEQIGEMVRAVAGPWQIDLGAGQVLCADWQSGRGVALVSAAGDEVAAGLALIACLAQAADRTPLRAGLVVAARGAWLIVGEARAELLACASAAGYQTSHAPHLSQLPTPRLWGWPEAICAAPVGVCLAQIARGSQSRSELLAPLRATEGLSEAGCPADVSAALAECAALHIGVGSDRSGLAWLLPSVLG